MKTTVPDLADLSEDEQHKEVYAWAGLALYWAQNIEQAVTILTWLGQVADGSLKRDFGSHEALLEWLDRKTLGQLLRTVRLHVSLSDDMEAKALEALRLRNFLVHSFFFQRVELFASRDGRQLMVEELADAVARLRKTDESLMDLALRFCASLGLPRERIEERLAEERRRWAAVSSA